MKNLRIYEILHDVSNADNQDLKLQLLKQHNCLALRDVLRSAFDDSIVFTLPKGLPKYKSSLSTEGIAPADLRRETQRFTYFVKGGKGDALTQLKRESMFLMLLEGIHPEDAEVLGLCKEKNLQSKFPGITKDLVKLAWPKLIAK